MMIATNVLGKTAASAIAPRDVHGLVGAHGVVGADGRGSNVFARGWRWYVAAVREPLPRDDDDGGDVW